MSDSLIQIENLTKTFSLKPGLFSKKKTQVHAVDGVNLSIREGEILGLIGESGSGKTTLARVLLGLTPASSGKLLIDGQNMVGAPRRTRKLIRSKVAVVFQDPASNLNPRQTVESSIVRPLRIRGMSRKEAHLRAVSALEKVKMDTRYLSAYPHQLSGGQQQRIAIARALVMEPRIMILDEPTSALDISVQAQVLNLLIDLQEELKLTYLVITHDLNVIQYLSDRVAVMYMGRLMETGDTQDVLEHPLNPYTQNLKQFIPVLNPAERDHSNRETFPGEPGDEIPYEGCCLVNRCSYATDRCRREAPVLTEYTPGHCAACFQARV